MTRAHDIGLRLVEKNGEVGFEVIVGGGLGRTPMIGKILRAFLPKADLLPYIEATISVWNLLGRRDNKYKSRIKLVESRFTELRPSFNGADQSLFDDIKPAFAAPAYKQHSTELFEQNYSNDPRVTVKLCKSKCSCCNGTGCLACIQN